ncbi:lasso peptide biosynthesis B2 protein [Kitasatospora xanthocidica]|uniref:lasso peptide biosynthesis B2 protein n=1 Tax=Kitasatospora xanthocidica TaxID=83382 RepID=UPI0036EECFE9
MTDLPAFVAVPAHVRIVDFGHVLVLVDYRTGRVQGLLPAAAEHWRQIARTGRTTDLPSALAEQLLGAGLLSPAAVPVPWRLPAPVAAPDASWGSTEHRAGVDGPTRAPVVATLTAASALAAILAVKRVGSPATAMHRLIRTIHQAASTCHHPATPSQASAAVRAVRGAAWHSPARTACLEESAAAVLLLAARRLSITWCHGVAADPVRLHAWVQTEDGSPVAEPPSTLAYTPVLTLGARHRHQL